MRKRCELRRLVEPFFFFPFFFVAKGSNRRGSASVAQTIKRLVARLIERVGCENVNSLPRSSRASRLALSLHFNNRWTIKLLDATVESYRSWRDLWDFSRSVGEIITPVTQGAESEVNFRLIYCCVSVICFQLLFVFRSHKKKSKTEMTANVK